MKNIIDWASERARMVLFFVVLSLIAGFYSYFNLPKEVRFKAFLSQDLAGIL